MALPKTILDGRIVFALVVVTNIVYFLILWWSIPSVQQFAPSTPIPDLMPFGYDYDYIVNLLTALGEEGRANYLSVQIPIDMIYPLLFGISYSVLLAWLFTKMSLMDSKWTLLVFLPLGAALFDYLENVTIIMMLTSLDDLSEGLVSTSSIFTIIKSAFTTLYFTSLIITFIVFAIKRIKR